MRKDIVYLIILTFTAMILIFVNVFFGAAVARIFRPAVGENEIERLRAENILLNAELAKQSLVNLPQTGLGEKVFVYSRYPFNLKHELLVSVGKQNKVDVGSAVLFDGLFLGKINKAGESFSVVQTIFDSRFEMAVRVGAKGVDALLEGGNEPRLKLIDGEIHPGDVIYSATPEFSFGLAVGSVKEFNLAKGESFGNASISLSYAPSDIKVVEILEPKRAIQP